MNKLNSTIKELRTQIKLDKEKLEKKRKLNYNIKKEAIVKIKLAFEEKRKKHINNIDELLLIIDEKIKKNKNNSNQQASKDDEIIDIIYENEDKEIVKLENKLKKFNKNILSSKINSRDNSNINKYTKLKENLKKCILNQRKKYQNEVVDLFSKKGYGKVGLKNIGNNCYINSALQILKNIPKFTLNLIRLDKNDSFLDSFKELLINICSSENTVFSPNRFKSLLGKENNKFEGIQQYDSTIFYISLLNIIHKKINNAKKEEYIKYDKKAFENEDITKQFQEWKKSFLSRNKSFIFKNFYIFYVNKMKCTSCNKETHTFQSANFFDFPIVSKKKNVENLEECFYNFQEINDLTNKDNFNCSNCNELTLNIQFIILELPPILMINLKRVGENQSYYHDIEIPFELEMDKIIKNSNITSIYELRGFIKHDGTERAGHNYAFCKNMFDEKWYEYNDSNCRAINGIPSLEKIFFLCYIKIGCEMNHIDYLKEIVDNLNKHE